MVDTVIKHIPYSLNGIFVAFKNFIITKGLK